jgi:hypothetical protein
MEYKKTVLKLIEQHNKINSIQEWNIWADNICSTKFGTYGTISIFEVIENTKVKFINSFIKDSFINECKDALNGIRL